jgi:4-amino-4-deoxy-L-arabinose transferase-like glycosyltransferase
MGRSRANEPSLASDRMGKAGVLPWLLGVVLLLALSLRLWGINFGLPYLYHPDEPVFIQIAQRIFKTGDLNPHFFEYGSLFFYLHALAYVPYFLIGKLAGIFRVPNDIPELEMITMAVGRAPMPTAVLMERSLTVICGWAIVLLVFLIGRKLTGRTWGGLLTALLVAVSPINVNNSRFATPDIMVTCFALVVLWLAMQMLASDRTWLYILAGVAIGLTASIKVNGVLIAGCVVMAHFLRSGAKGLRDYRIYLAAVLALLSFLLTSPYILLDFYHFSIDFTRLTAQYTKGHPGMEGEPVRYYLRTLWTVEGPVSVLAVLGLAFGVWARFKPIYVVAAYPSLYSVLIANLVVRNERTLLPVLPFLALLAAYFVAVLFDRLLVARPLSALLSGKSSLAWHTRAQPLTRSDSAPVYHGARQEQRALLICLLLVVIVVAVPFWRTVDAARQITGVDSREMARRWIEPNIPHGTRIAVESYAPFVDPRAYQVLGVPQMRDHSADWYLERGYSYLIFSSGMYGRYYADPGRYSQQIVDYDKLLGACTATHTFRSVPWVQEVHICRLTAN